MPTGTVKWFNSDKGYGFITDESGADQFVHILDVEDAGLSGLTEGQCLEFEVGVNRKNGRPKAVNLKLIDVADLTLRP